MESYVHAVGKPTVLSVVGLFTDNFNPHLPVGVCHISGVYTAACAFNDDIECERRGTLGCDIVSNVHDALSLISSTFGANCTWLVYWTAQQQKLVNTRDVVTARICRQITEQTSMPRSGFSTRMVSVHTWRRAGFSTLTVRRYWTFSNGK
ncbi:hypothetical protein ACA910_012401 [Epithemia clementina (nom. ined.)]